MNVNQGLPSSLIIWVVSYLPHNEPGATLPRPKVGGTLWSPPLPFGMRWKGLPVTNVRTSPAPDPNALGLAHFGAELTFTVDKNTKIVTAKVKSLPGIAYVEFADPDDGKRLGFGQATSKPRVAVTVVKTGNTWRTTVDFRGSVRLDASLPSIGVDGRFVLAHTHEMLTSLEFHGAVIGFPAHECMFILDKGPIFSLFKVASDPAATDDLRTTFGFGRPVFFEDTPMPLFRDEFLKLPDGKPGPGNAVRFTDAKSVDEHFKRNQGAPFHEWFSANLANKGAFGGPHGLSLGKAATAKKRLKLLMDSLPEIFEAREVSLMQFIALFCIVSRESFGFRTYIEDPDATGLAYFYKYDGKKSIGNRKIYDLLADEDFWNAHKDEQPKDYYDLKGKEFDARRRAWKLPAYPGVSKVVDIAVNGYIMQADFYKFIGHGPLQLTGRSNFEQVIEFIKGYGGTDKVLGVYKKKWSGKTAGVAATESKVQDWRKLFADGEQLPVLSIRLHSNYRGDYLKKLSPDPATLRDGGISTPGSLSYMADMVNKSTSYRDVFRARVRDFIGALKWTA